MTKEQKQALIEDLDRVSSECVNRKYVSNGKDERECAFCFRDLDAVDSEYAQHTEDCLTRKLQKHVEILEESIGRDS